MEFQKFNSLPPNKQLDYILGVINSENNPKTMNEILEGLNWNTSDFDASKIVHLILIKLTKDEYITKVQTPFSNIPNTTINTYYISFEGNVFIGNGGYGNKNRKESIATNAVLINSLVVGVGAFFALVWVCFQIYDWFHKCCSYHH